LATTSASPAISHISPLLAGNVGLGFRAAIEAEANDPKDDRQILLLQKRSDAPRRQTAADPVGFTLLCSAGD
jgi:hypothetical protein